tara:strand:- start:1003 stop:2013 length:1011 start_codon:yes stop_codon:yes gene_type:complete
MKALRNVSRQRMVSAKKNKNDDFYTSLSDIEKEIKHYKKHLIGKTIYLNCDDPRISNFFHYFSYNFKQLELKKLYSTAYKNNQIDLFSNNNQEKGILLEYSGDKNDNKIPDLEEISITNLNGDGDFRSSECIEVLEKSDIVVTNPPFSLFREYVQQLIEHDKKFIIMGHQNAITYKEIFSYIKEGKIWLGHDNGGTKWFEVKNHYEIKTKSRQKTENGKKYFSMGNVVWFTNLEIQKRKEEIILYKKYTKNEYPAYDNYNAINVDKVTEIPFDYDGYMGVPITFLDKHNKNQFDIYGIMNTGEENKGIRYPDTLHGRPIVDGKEKYLRILIKNKDR